MPGQPAALAGMQVGDRIVSVNGKPAGDFVSFGKLVQADAVKSPNLSIGIERAGRPLQLAVTAKWESLGGQPQKWVMGVGAPPAEAATDRKSVGEGKSVSVREAPGGRRIIKKKTSTAPTSSTNTY